MNLKGSFLVLLRCGWIAVMITGSFSALAQDIFMRIGGQAAAMGSQQTTPTLAGESSDPQYTNWIPVLSMSHGVSSTVTLGGGGGAKPNHSDVALMKTIDKTTPSICLLVNATNVTAGVTQPIDYVTIDFRKPGTTQVFYRMELQGVYLTSDHVSGSAGSDVPSESVTFLYSKIRWSYVAYVSGKAQAPITKGWDVVAGKAF